jgi:thiamine-monophosphate kinase
MTIAAVGEFGLIRRIQDGLSKNSQKATDLVLGIGDDAAVWRISECADLLLTTDVMVEGTHFTRGTTPWEDLGWKSLAVNVSDIAAMGGIPRLALLTLGLRGDEQLSDIDAFLRGATRCADQFAIVIAGGDTVRADQMLVSWVVMGQALTLNSERVILRRDAARSGDLIAVTGWCGQSAAGLDALLHQETVDNRLISAHWHPIPRIAEAQWLLHRGVRCGIDTSDSIYDSLERICERSGVVAEIETSRLPLSSLLQAYTAERASSYAIWGGEDYELLVCLRPELYDGLRADWAETFSVPLTVIGRCLSSASAHTQRVVIRDAPSAGSRFGHFGST